MSTERKNNISVFEEDTDATVVTFIAEDDETVRKHAHSFYETVFDIPNKGFNPPEPPEDVQQENCHYLSAVTIYYPKSVALEVVHDWLADNSINFTQDGDEFYYA